MYELLIVIRIVSAIVWIGEAMTLLWAFRGVRAAEGPEAADQTWARLEKSTRAFDVAPFLVLGTGLALVSFSDAWSFSQMWIYLAISLLLVSLVLGGGLADRLVKQMDHARQQGRVASELFTPLLRLGGVELVILLSIVVLMVYKPI